MTMMSQADSLLKYTKRIFLILRKGDGQYTDVLERFELWMENAFFFSLFFFC